MSCAFCGMPPRDGEPCCTATYRRDVMKAADARAKRAELEVNRLQSRCASIEMTWSEACKAEARDCGCWGRIMDMRTKWKEANL